MPAVVSRTEARALGLTRYFTGQTCKRGHIVERLISNRSCVECTRISKNRWTRGNPEKHRASYARWAKKHPEKRLANQRKRRALKPHVHRANARRHRRTPTGILRALCTATTVRIWRRANRSHLNHLSYTAEEFISHMENDFSFGMSVDEARAYGYHVDHFVPVAIISEICANKETAFRMAMDLDNLRMIPGSKNMSKGTKMNSQQEEALARLCTKYGVTHGS